jgi:gas vesicle protein
MNKRDRLAVFGIVLAGSSLGFLTGVLTAPRSGRKTRRLLARRMEEERRDLMRRGRDSLKDAGEALEERLEDGRRAVSRAMGA